MMCLLQIGSAALSIENKKTAAVQMQRHIHQPPTGPALAATHD
jgi:hypothetical protein